ncbi:hypothetical protein D917_05344 [Trichinella nativa]|uniref:Uncharacterized protein n=1 Tax=Trichinella nativa TaxID=6335 RepID=A0A1Y3EXH1_9BILA|nr:hypothetical protein D917_05344 [Trichinella nativa]
MKRIKFLTVSQLSKTFTAGSLPVVSTVCTRHQAEKPLGRIIRFCIGKDEAELITSEPCLTIVSQDQSARMNEHFHIQNPAADQLPIV